MPLLSYKLRLQHSSFTDPTRLCHQRLGDVWTLNTTDLTWTEHPEAAGTRNTNMVGLVYKEGGRLLFITVGGGVFSGVAILDWHTKQWESIARPTHVDVISHSVALQGDHILYGLGRAYKSLAPANIFYVMNLFTCVATHCYATYRGLWLTFCPPRNARQRQARVDNSEPWWRGSRSALWAPLSLH